MRLHRLIALSLYTLHFAACGGDDPQTTTPPTGTTPPTHTTPPRAGKTGCGTFGQEAISCNPGSYCADQVLSRCESGCIGDMNCPTSLKR